MIDMGVVMNTLHAVTAFFRSLFKGAPDVRECYAVLAARQEPVFRDVAAVSPHFMSGLGAGRRRASRRA